MKIGEITIVSVFVCLLAVPASPLLVLYAASAVRLMLCCQQGLDDDSWQSRGLLSR